MTTPAPVTTPSADPFGDGHLSLAGADPSRRRDRPGKAAIMRAAITVMGEDGYEGASMRDMASRAGVTVAALYYHFPSKIDLLREFLDESWDVVNARVDRRLAAADPAPAAQLDELVATLIASYLHDEFAQMASNVGLREYTRLEGDARAAIDGKRLQLLERATAIIDSGVEDGSMRVTDPGETARAILILCSSLVEPFASMGRSMAEVIELYQGFARRLVGL